MKIVGIMLVLCMSMIGHAEELAPVATAEIEHLLQYLEHSDCQFERNGSWYGAGEAAAHLRKKYDYLRKKNMLSTAESFIEKAASQSSVSGKAYQVKCGGKAVMESGDWFIGELGVWRGRIKS